MPAIPHTSPISDLDAALQIRFDPIMALTFYLDAIQNTPTIRKSKLSPHDYSDAICICLHRLLDYAPLNPKIRPKLSAIDNVVHLSLVAVMTTLMPEYGFNQARYGLLASELGQALQTYAMLATSNNEMCLWALFVGYVTVLPSDVHAWLVPLVTKKYVNLKFQAWVEVREVLRRYAWSSLLYDKAGLNLWNSIRRG